MSLLAYYTKKDVLAQADLLDQLFPFRYLFSVRKRLTNDLTYPNLQIQRSNGDLLPVTLNVNDDWTSVLPSVVSWLGGSIGRVTKIYCQKTGLEIDASVTPALIDAAGNLLEDTNGNVACELTSLTTLSITSGATSLFKAMHDGSGSGATVITLSECSANGMLLSNRTAGGNQQGIDLEYRGTSTMRFFGKSNDNTTEFYEPTGFAKNTSHNLFMLWQPQISISGQRTRAYLNGSLNSSTTTGTEPTPNSAEANMGIGISGAAATSRMSGFFSDFIYDEGSKESDRAAIMTILNYL
jgi:hypothetical protein